MNWPAFGLLQSRALWTLLCLAAICSSSVADGVAYVTARASGVYIIDVHDPRKPEMLCHCDCIELATGVEVQGDLLFIVYVAGDVVCCADTFNGVFVVDDFIYAACPKAGLKLLAAPSLVRSDRHERGTPISVPPAPRETPEHHRVYRPGGQVWSVDFCGEHALIIPDGRNGLLVYDDFVNALDLKVDKQSFLTP